jgi:hypothetical protein
MVSVCVRARAERSFLDFGVDSWLPGRLALTAVTLGQFSHCLLFTNLKNNLLLFNLKF